MKKRFSKIFLLLVLVLIVASFGCKGASDLDMSKVKKWNNLQSITGKDTVQCINLVADNEAIDWWIITDVNGVVLKPGEDYNFVTEKGVETTGTESASIEKGKSIWLKFTKADDVVVWIYQSEVEPKEGEKGSKDFRGRVNIEKSQGFTVNASSYREEVSHVGIVKIRCNETAKGNTKDNCTSASWTGNYRITEVWPLTNKNGPQWEAAEGLKFIFTDDPIEEGESRRVIYPAGNSVFAIRQPDRFAKNPAENSEEAEAKAKQVDWYWCAAFYPSNGTSGLINDTDESNLAFTELGAIEAHEEKELTSYQCGAYFKLGNQTLYKSALGTTYIVDEFFNGSSEK